MPVKKRAPLILRGRAEAPTPQGRERAGTDDSGISGDANQVSEQAETQEPEDDAPFIPAQMRLRKDRGHPFYGERSPVLSNPDLVDFQKSQTPRVLPSGAMNDLNISLLGHTGSFNVKTGSLQAPVSPSGGRRLDWSSQSLQAPPGYSPSQSPHSGPSKVPMIAGIPRGGSSPVLPFFPSMDKMESTRSEVSSEASSSMISSTVITIATSTTSIPRSMSQPLNASELGMCVGGFRKSAHEDEVIDTTVVPQITPEADKYDRMDSDKSAQSIEEEVRDASPSSPKRPGTSFKVNMDVAENGVSDREVLEVLVSPNRSPSPSRSRSYRETDEVIDNVAASPVLEPANAASLDGSPSNRGNQGLVSQLFPSDDQGTMSPSVHTEEKPKQMYRQPSTELHRQSSAQIFRPPSPGKEKAAHDFTPITTPVISPRCQAEGSDTPRLNARSVPSKDPKEHQATGERALSPRVHSAGVPSDATRELKEMLRNGGFSPLLSDAGTPAARRLATLPEPMVDALLQIMQFGDADAEVRKGSKLMVSPPLNNRNSAAASPAEASVCSVGSERSEASVTSVASEKPAPVVSSARVREGLFGSRSTGSFTAQPGNASLPKASPPVSARGFRADATPLSSALSSARASATNGACDTPSELGSHVEKSQSARKAQRRVSFDLPVSTDNPSSNGSVSRSFTLEELQNRKKENNYSGLDSKRLEDCLVLEGFSAAFGMDPEEFSKQPAWKCEQLKKKAGIS